MSAVQSSLLWRAVAVLAAAGALISGYLTYTHYAHQPVVCAGLGSCATVQSSEYAELVGVPVALLGLGMYIVIGVLALLAHRPEWPALAAFGIALCGTLYSGYLTWIELAVLDAICLWCVASAAVIATAMVLAGVALRVSHQDPPPARQRLG